MPKRKIIAKKGRRKQDHRGTVLLLLGGMLLGIWGIHKLLYLRAMTFSLRHAALFTSASAPTAYPSEIRIGERINLAVVPAGYVNGNWLISDRYANHVTKSASPGDTGNIIIYAHNNGSMFGPLTMVQKGEEISVKTKDGKIRRYRVFETHEVEPSDTRYLLPTPTEILTLYTCTGFLDSRRFIVRAIPFADN